MPTSSTTTAGPPSNRFPIWAVGLALVVVLGVVAVVASLGGGDDDVAVPEGVEQTRPVAVAGDPLPEAADGAADPAIGLAFPEVRGASFDGEPVAITADGTPKVVLYLAHWCGFCQEEVPEVQAWLDANGAPEGVALYSVATSTQADQPNHPPSAWLEEEGWEVPVLADDEASSAARAAGLSGFPFFVAVDADGAVVARAAGAIGAEGLEQLLALARGGA